MVKNDVLLKWHADVAHLRDLMRHEGWERYLGFAEKVLNEEIENTLLIPPDAPAGLSAYQRGVVAGIRRALNIPAEVIRNTDLARKEDT